MAVDITREEVRSFLNKISIMSLSAVGKRGPVSTVVLFYAGPNLDIYFATHKDSYKSKALVDDPRVSLSVWEFKNMLVQADGRAEVVEKTNDVEKVLDLLAESAGKLEDFWPPILSLEGGDYIVFKIKLNWLRVLPLSRLNINEKDVPFIEINLA